MLLWITPKKRLEAYFHILDEKGKIIKGSSVTSEACSFETNKYYTVRLHAADKKVRLFLDGKNVAYKENMLDFSSFATTEKTDYCVTFFGFYPFYRDYNLSRKTLNGYIDEIKINLGK